MDCYSTGVRTMTKTTVGHCKRDSIDTYIGRGPNGRGMFETPIGERGWLGNPFTLENHHRGASIAKFKEVFLDRLEGDEAFRNAVHDLEGDTLGCWCRSVDDETPACHGDVIADYLNGEL